jgi:hypothetical protein
MREYSGEIVNYLPWKILALWGARNYLEKSPDSGIKKTSLGDREVF